MDAQLYKKSLKDWIDSQGHVKKTPLKLRLVNPPSIMPNAASDCLFFCYASLSFSRSSYIFFLRVSSTGVSRDAILLEKIMARRSEGRTMMNALSNIT